MSDIHQNTINKLTNWQRGKFHADLNKLRERKDRKHGDEAKLAEKWLNTQRPTNKEQTS